MMPVKKATAVPAPELRKGPENRADGTGARARLGIFARLS